jgi:NAD(P)-dependent dehydrogenase (short-subunit alcohol dehydrogenase family)
MSSDKVVLVTGGTRGIGAAIALHAAAKGYAVCVTYAQDEIAAENTISSLKEHEVPVLAVKGRVEDADFARDVFAQAEGVLGPVTAVVNNAGVTGRIGAFVDATPATLRTILDVNLLGPMLLSQEAIRRWQASGRHGAIVNISSIASTLGAPNEYVAYAASKAGIEAFTIGLAKEVAATNIRVNAVAPGTVYTDIHAAAGEPNRPERVVSRVPMGRIGEPKEIAHAVVWLLSEEASYVTGAVLRVSGGL